jgi:hypothetical protein
MNSFLKAICSNGSTLYINTSKVSLDNILKSIEKCSPIYKIDIIDYFNKDDIKILHTSYTLGLAPKCELIDMKTGTNMKVKYNTHRIIEFITNQSSTNLQ